MPTRTAKVAACCVAPPLLPPASFCLAGDDTNLRTIRGDIVSRGQPHASSLLLPPSFLLAVGELHSLRCNLHFPQSSHLRIRALYTLNVKNYRARGRIGSHCVVLVSRRQVPQGNFPLFFPPSFAIARCSPACKRHLHIGTTVLYHVRET